MEVESIFIIKKYLTKNDLYLNSQVSYSQMMMQEIRIQAKMTVAEN